MNNLPYKTFTQAQGLQRLCQMFIFLLEKTIQIVPFEDTLGALLVQYLSIQY